MGRKAQSNDMTLNGATPHKSIKGCSLCSPIFLCTLDPSRCPRTVKNLYLVVLFGFFF